MRAYFLIAIGCITLLALAQTIAAQRSSAASAPPDPPSAPPASDPKLPGQDWPQLNRYRAANAALGDPRPGEQRVVFLGDSITDSWINHNFFPGKPYIDRGISGQTTPQMLIRFQPDVLHLKPAVVVVLAGINDIAENTGPAPMSAIQDNFRSMVALAKAAHVRVVLSSVLPASYIPWRPTIHPTEKVKELNQWVRRFAQEQNVVYLDYYDAMVNPQGGMREELAGDKYVHPNEAGYAIMAPLAEAAIARALASPAP